VTGQTCGAYAASFLATAAGYLTNPDATSTCGYCANSWGSDYVGSLGYKYSERWRDWGEPGELPLDSSRKLNLFHIARYPHRPVLLQHHGGVLVHLVDPRKAPLQKVGRRLHKNE
jgi:hypothetical protein